MSPIKLLPKTNSLINLLPSKPHHTFNENLLWKMIIISCDFHDTHIHELHELFMLSKEQDNSSTNKIIQDQPLSCNSNPHIIRFLLHDMNPLTIIRI
jgi:hypothetical protein